MKTLLAASAAILALAACAANDEAKAADIVPGVGLGAEMEVTYSLENETAGIELGPNISVMDFNIETRVNVEYNSELGAEIADDFVNNGYSVKAAYGITDNVEVFGEVILDKNFGQEDTQLGVTLSF